jgi:Zn-dependent protease with chaperone function
LFRHSALKRPKFVWFYEASFVFLSLFLFSQYRNILVNFRFVPAKEVAQIPWSDEKLSSLIIEKTGVHPSFIVLDTPAIGEAYTLPGPKGFRIFLSRGLIERLDGNQLAFVILHEITHDLRRHYQWRIVFWIVAVAVFFFLSWVCFKRFSKQFFSTRLLRLLILYGVLMILLLPPFSFARRNEYGADRQAAMWLSNPAVGIETLNRLTPGDSGNVSWWRRLYSLHPSIDDRIKHLHDLEAENPTRFKNEN